MNSLALKSSNKSKQVGSKSRNKMAKTVRESYKKLSETDASGLAILVTAAPSDQRHFYPKLRPTLGAAARTLAEKIIRPLHGLSGGNGVQKQKTSARA